MEKIVQKSDGKQKKKKQLVASIVGYSERIHEDLVLENGFHSACISFPSKGK